MKKLTRDDLWSLEDYAKKRAEYRQQVMAHKKPRHIALNDHANLYFEDRMTMQYQIQEMLRIEKIFEEDGINDELAAYNPLIPDGKNLKATFMLEYTDVNERQAELARLKGIEDKVWIQIDGHDKVYAIADEDLERDNEEKTSSVHFMRFEFDDAMIASAKQGKPISMGLEHENMSAELRPIAEASRQALVADFD